MENSQYPIAHHQDGKIAAGVTLIIDKRLPAGEAFFGFLETPNDQAIFRVLWDKLIGQAREKGVTTLKGPVNGSIWHEYRCIKESDGSPFFKTEPRVEPYYYSLLKGQSPTAEITYHSASRSNLEKIIAILAAGKPAYEKLTAAGFTIEKADSANAQHLQTIIQLSRKIFAGSWGYTELTENEFTELYSPEKISAELRQLYLLRHNEQIIGFCSTLKEDETTLILKTIGILPEYQAMGLGSFFAYHLHQDAQAQGVKKIIYALIRDDNRVKNFPMDDIIFFRRYSSFEFKV